MAGIASPYKPGRGRRRAKTGSDAQWRSRRTDAAPLAPALASPPQCSSSSPPPSRLLTVHLLTLSLVEEYVANLPAFCAHYYERQSNHSVLLVAPTAQAPALARRLAGPSCQPPTQHAQILAWKPEACGSRFLLQAVDIAAPRRYAQLQASCNGRNWSQEYALYSGSRLSRALTLDASWRYLGGSSVVGSFFVSQLLWLPSLGDSDWYVKVDTDVVFQRPMPFDLSIELARDPKTVVAHTGLQPSNLCERGVLQALRRFRSRGAVRPPPPMSPWCESAESLPAVFYGNFVAYRTAFMVR